MWTFLGMFENLRKATIGTRRYGTNRLPLDGFSWNLVFGTLRKFVEKIQVSLKCDKNNGRFTWIPVSSGDNISLNSFENWKCFRVVEKVFPPPSSEKSAVYKTVWKNIVEVERPQMTVRYDAEKVRFACRVTKTRMRTHSRYLVLITINSSTEYSVAR
jgi:hypothetical protein